MKTWKWSWGIPKPTENSGAWQLIGYLMGIASGINIALYPDIFTLILTSAIFLVLLSNMWLNRKS